MRTRTILVILASIVVVVGIAYSFIREKDVPADTKPPTTARLDPSSRFIHVDDLAKKPEGHTGEIVLRAVVSGVNRPKGVCGPCRALPYRNEQHLDLEREWPVGLL